MSGSRPRSRQRLAQLLRPVGRRIRGEDGHLLSTLLHVGCAPGDMPVAGRLDAGQGALERERE